MTKRADVVATARTALKTPWVHQGRIVPHGVDCIGLILYTARKLHITEYEPPPYPKRAEWSKFIGFFRSNLDEIKIADAGPGDILTFRQSIYPCHCGILTTLGTDPHFIHSYLLRGKVTEERYSAEWRKNTLAAFRFPGIED